MMMVMNALMIRLILKKIGIKRLNLEQNVFKEWEKKFY